VQLAILAHFEVVNCPAKSFNNFLIGADKALNIKYLLQPAFPCKANNNA
jgi:pyoverdine/dityrosine biosynthesis protein Dit1